jgi:hypothetical protein
MKNDTQPMDAHLEILMQWLKDNDESDASVREHANRDSQFIPDILEPGSEGYD